MLILAAFAAKGVLGVEFDRENVAFAACSHLCTVRTKGTDMLALATGTHPAIMPLTYFVFCMVVSLGFCTVIHQYILWFNCAHYYMFYICGCEAHFVINSLLLNSGLPTPCPFWRADKRSCGVAEPPHNRNCALRDLGAASCCGTRFSGSSHSSSVRCAKKSVEFCSKYGVACFVRD